MTILHPMYTVGCNRIPSVTAHYVTQDGICGYGRFGALVEVGACPRRMSMTILRCRKEFPFIFDLHR